MIPRGKLDISYRDLLSAAGYSLFGSLYKYPQTEKFLTCLSVRSAFDLLLQAINLPAGSEILITEVNIPGMFQIIEAHQLIPVPVPINKTSLNVSTDTIEALITPNTRAIVFAHLFGSIADMTEIVVLAKRNNLLLIEDCAQAFDGIYRGHEQADVVLFSFGMIKTNTALGGARVLIHDNPIRKKVKELQKSLPLQPAGQFLKKAFIAFVIKIVSSKQIYPYFYRFLLSSGKDPDKVLSGFTRGFPSGELLEKIRKRPSKALCLMMERRIRKFDLQIIAARAKYGRAIYNGVNEHFRIGNASSVHTHWVLPVHSDKPRQLVANLRNAGFDASAKASSMINFSKESSGSEKLELAKVVYIPMHPNMKKEDKQKLIELINLSA